MIIIAAWKSKISGLGHYTRSKKYFEFLKNYKKLVKFITFKNLNDLYNKLKDLKQNTILLDTYIFSKKIEILLRKNFKRIILTNDNQFKPPKDFYLLETFKFFKKNKKTKIFFGIKYLPFFKKYFHQNKVEKKYILIILHKNYQMLYKKFFKQLNMNFKKYLKKKIFINVTNKNIQNKIKLYPDCSFKKFISQEKLLNYAKNSEYIISPGGQTMMNLVEKNLFINVYKTAGNQNYYIKKLSKNHYINLLDFKNFKLKKNKKTNYYDISKINKQEIFKVFY